MHHCDFGTMLLNHWYILLIACLLLFSKINLHLSVCFVVLLVIIFAYFWVPLFSLFASISCSQIGFPFFSMCVLRICSSHLGYCCLDLASHRIYVSCHVRFHEYIFHFANSEQITHTPVPSTQPTHLPPLNPPQFFQPTILPTCSNNTPILPSVAPQKTPHLPIASSSASPPSR